MKAWLFLLGGLVLWALHFFGVYGIGSLFPGTELARWLVLAYTALCLGAAGLLLSVALRRRTRPPDEFERWSAALAASGYALALVTIVYQGLPAIAL